MALIRGRDTGPEMALRRALYAAGVRGWRCHVPDVFGRPDLLWRSKRVAVFVDSAWWHGHPSRFTPGKLSLKWDAKITRNRERDREVNARLSDEGWRVLRFWDFEIERDLDRCVDAVREAVSERRV
jgi:DNA mismatch endonuclease (patch repair protein)